MAGGPADYLKVGDWNAICDVCGFKFKASQLKKRWDGFMVCDKDWERRHPQDFLKAKPDSPTPPWTRPVVPDDFVEFGPVDGDSL